MEKKLLNVYLCICKFESIPLFAAYKCDGWNLCNWQFVRVDECGELPPVNSAFMVPGGRGRERGRDQVGLTILQL